MSYDYRSFRKVKFKFAGSESSRRARGGALKHAAAVAPGFVFTRRVTIAAAKIARSLQAKTVNDPNRGSVISLAGATVAAGVNLAEIRMLVVALEQANRPALFEFHVEAATGHPYTGPPPMAELSEAALAFQVVTRIPRPE